MDGIRKKAGVAPGPKRGGERASTETAEWRHQFDRRGRTVVFEGGRKSVWGWGGFNRFLETPFSTPNVPRISEVALIFPKRYKAGSQGASIGGK